MQPSTIEKREFVTRLIQEAFDDTVENTLIRFLKEGKQAAENLAKRETIRAIKAEQKAKELTQKAEQEKLNIIKNLLLSSSMTHEQIASAFNVKMSLIEEIVKGIRKN